MRLRLQDLSMVPGLRSEEDFIWPSEIYCAERKPMVRTPGIEPGTIRYLQRLQSNALPTELCSV